MKKRAGASKKPRPKASEPIVWRKFGPTGKPVAISKRVAEVARREGLRVEEDGALGSDLRSQPSRRKALTHPLPPAQLAKARKPLPTRRRSID